MVDKLDARAWEKCKEIILEDVKLKEIDVEFYDLLDAVESDVAAKLEEAYIDYGTRAVQLAYEQGVKDSKKIGAESE